MYTCLDGIMEKKSDYNYFFNDIQISKYPDQHIHILTNTSPVQAHHDVIKKLTKIVYDN